MELSFLTLGTELEKILEGHQTVAVLGTADPGPKLSAGAGPCLKIFC